MEKKYWLAYSGMGWAGSSAGQQMPEIVYGTEEDANKVAYEGSIQMIQDHEGTNGIPYFTDSPEDFDGEDVETEPYENIENHADYFVHEITLARLENEDLEEEFVRRVSEDGYLPDWEKYLEKLGYERETN